MKNERVLGLDYGEARIGIAISDPSQVLATPLETITNDENSMDRISKIACDNGVTRLVVGYPLNLKGEKAVSAKKVERFIRRLQRLGLEVIRWDERFSTKSALDFLHQAGRKPFKEKDKIDRCAAAIILQGYLDSRRHI